MCLRHIVGLYVFCALCGLAPMVAGAAGEVAILEAADRPARIAVPAQPIEAALNEFARQSGIHVVIDSRIAGGILSTAVDGKFRTAEALTLLLKSTGLTYRVLDGRTISVEKAADHSTSREALTDSALRLAQAGSPTATDGAVADGAAQVSAASHDARSALTVEEIVVTAQKRIERLQEVPVPVTAVDAGGLEDSNQVRLQDFFARVPGLNFQAGSRAEPLISIRGINSLQNPTVGFMLDDVPYGSTVFRGGGFVAPDIDPADLARIEVLRGPQGTLYGVSSLGGLIKYVTIDPSTDRMSGYVRTGLNTIHGSDGLGFDVSGAINLPLSDTLAVRASAFTRSSPGYIDNPAVGAEDVNEADASGGRLAALWKPSESFTVKVSALHQERDSDGADFVAPSLGDLQQSYPNGRGWSRRKYEAYNATITGTAGPVEITSLTGYNRNEFHSSVDVPAFSAVANASFGVSAATQDDHFQASKVTQELRAVVPLGERFEWLIGGFYTDEDFTNPIDIPAVNPTTGATAGTLATFDGRGGYEEYAGFTDLTTRITERFDVQIGGRWSHNSQNYSEIDTGVPQLVAGGRIVIPDTVVEATPITYLLTPRFRFSPDLMVYGRFATGYRAGGINLFFARGFPVPPGYDSDRTYNYEIGAKGNLFDQAVSFDVSVFHIDWKDLQLAFSFAPGVNFQDNASRAKSQGVELSVETRPLAGLHIALSLTYDDAVLTEGFGVSTTNGVPGDRLPFTSELAGNLSVEQAFSVANGWTATVGASASYVGERLGLFRPRTAPRRQEYPAYTQVDVRAGVERGLWKANLFVTNLTDRRGLVGGGLGQTNPNFFTYIRPRAIGISASRAF